MGVDFQFCERKHVLWIDGCTKSARTVCLTMVRMANVMVHASYPG